ncbi:hypothetical protein BPOR_0380g00080 [Botrytis porri]|uniref:Uncharacterized protein n=1 Tax=Botrytis porri TaxID=87229 RepID=A0A4Z1KMR2_9HELO|nr:hypothetical protein BPOR_0380g00080 [Botrytis porri]
MRSVQTPFPLASIEAAQRLGLHLRGKSLDFSGSHWPSSAMRNGYAHNAQALAEHTKQPPVMIYQ